MKIGYDGKRAVQNFTGLGNYSRYVLEALQEYFPDNEYVIYAPKRRKNPRLKKLLEKGNAYLRFPSSAWWTRFPALWRIWGITDDWEKDGIVLFHGLSNELPLNIGRQKRVKSVVTIHDLIFRRLPQCYPIIDRWIYDYKFKKACQKADKIIAVSECTKRDIISDYGIPADKIEVIYQGCDPIFAQSVSDDRKVEVLKRYALPKHYILSVGSIEERKNALLIVKSLLHLPVEYHLVLVGKETAYTKKVIDFICEYKLESRVNILQNVPFVDLPAIYQCAETFVYPSRYEGFGIPILEALNSRVPVVAATGSCLEEAGGPYSLYVHPDDDKGLAEAIVQSQFPQNRQRMVAEGLKWASQFSKGQMARETMECYKTVLNIK